MKTTISTLALCVGLMPFGALAQTQELNALVWCDHTDAALIKPFEEKFDVKVNLKEYEGTGAGLALIEQSQPGDWDVLVIDGDRRAARGGGGHPRAAARGPAAL